MKKSILVMALMIGSIGISIGQEKKPKTPEQKSENTTQRLTKQLELNENQQQQVKAITLQSAKEIHTIKQQIRVLKKQAKAIKKKENDDINAVLSDEQKEKWEKIKAQKQTKGDGKSKGAPKK